MHRMSARVRCAYARVKKVLVRVDSLGNLKPMRDADDFAISGRERETSHVLLVGRFNDCRNYKNGNTGRCKILCREKIIFFFFFILSKRKELDVIVRVTIVSFWRWKRNSWCSRIAKETWETRHVMRNLTLSFIFVIFRIFLFFFIFLQFSESSLG